MKINPNLKVKSDRSYYLRVGLWPSIFDIRRGSKILDVGCGTGNLGSYLQTTYLREITSLQITQYNFLVASGVLQEEYLGDTEAMNISALKG